MPKSSHSFEELDKIQKESESQERPDQKTVISISSHLRKRLHNLPDPKSPQELSEKLKELTTNRKLRSELIKKGKERVKLFSWQKCAEKTLKILQTA